MARIPKFFADYAERRGFVTRVDAVEPVGEGLLRIAFAGEGLRAVEPGPCDVTAFRIAANDFRHYTPETLDPAAGRATVLFHRHGQPDAPGLAMVEALAPGDAVTWCGLASARGFRWEAPRRVLALGDASTAGLLVSLTDRAHADSAELLAVIEVEEPDRAAVAELLPGAVVLAAGPRPGDAAAGWLADAGEAVKRLAPDAVYLAGHGQSVQAQRDLLRTVHGLDRRTIRTQPYWATGRTGL
jgi:NADPH-dependent ferric siderophore reductase